MLRITPDAATLISTLTHDARLSPSAGLRIVIDPAHQSLSMGISDNPAPADTIVRSAGARLFLSPAAAARLHGRTLRAELSANRSAFFLDK